MDKLKTAVTGAAFTLMTYAMTVPAFANGDPFQKGTDLANNTVPKFQMIGTALSVVVIIVGALMYQFGQEQKRTAKTIMIGATVSLGIILFAPAFVSWFKGWLG